MNKDIYLPTERKHTDITLKGKEALNGNDYIFGQASSQSVDSKKHKRWFSSS